MSPPGLRAYRVVVLEWLSHSAEIEAASPEDAENLARQLWADNAEHQLFEFESSGLDGVVVEEA